MPNINDIIRREMNEREAGKTHADKAMELFLSLDQDIKERIAMKNMNVFYQRGQVSIILILESLFYAAFEFGMSVQRELSKDENG